MTLDPFQNLKKAIEGLEYPSESDASFDLFHWPKSKAASALEQVATRAGANRKIAEVPIDSFFDALKDSDDAPRFLQLRHALESTLTNLKIFRAGDGETKVDIYVIGQTQSGDWAGLHTTSIET
jgi:hypothetical protein